MKQFIISATQVNNDVNVVVTDPISMETTTVKINDYDFDSVLMEMPDGIDGIYCPIGTNTGIKIVNVDIDNVSDFVRMYFAAIIF